MSLLTRILALAAAVALLTSCGSAAASDTASAAAADEAIATADGGVGHDHHTMAAPLDGRPAASAARDASIYQLGGDWRDQTAASRPLASLAGRPQVVAFVYTSCTFACPRIVANMKQIETEAASDVGLVLVSIDPERDTPERLAHFAEGSRLDPTRWTLLNGSDDQILELSVLLGVKYRATDDGEFAHTNVLILLDEQGVVIERVEGLDTELTPILARLAL